MVARNPFLHRGPIRDPASFHGRVRETEQALALLGSAQSVSIVGPRRIGKSSLLFHLANPAIYGRHGLATERECFVYVDCEPWGWLTAPEVHLSLLEELSEALDAGAAGQLALPSAPLSYRAFERAIRDVARRGLHITLLLDEFEALGANPHLDADFFSGLRALATRHAISFVTASATPLLELTYTNRGVLSSPFFNFFAQLRLRLFSRTEAEALLSAPAPSTGVAFDARTVDELLELAGPHPFLLQIAAYHAWELQSRRDGPLDGHDHAYLRGLFLAEAEAHWSYFWRTLAAEDQRALVLLPVAARSDPAAVRRLVDAGLVRTENDEAVPLSEAFGAFIRQQAVPGLLQASPVALDREQRIALAGGRVLALTPTEFEVLVCLLAEAGRVVAHRQLEERVWPGEYIDDPERLKTAIKTLRRALGDAASCLQNVRGTGYMFVPQH